MRFAVALFVWSSVCSIKEEPVVDSSTFRRSVCSDRVQNVELSIAGSTQNQHYSKEI